MKQLVSSEGNESACFPDCESEDPLGFHFLNVKVFRSPLYHGVFFPEGVGSRTLIFVWFDR